MKKRLIGIAMLAVLSAVMIFVLSGCSSSGKANEPKPTEEQKKTVYGVGEPADINDVVITLVSVTEDTGELEEGEFGFYITPKEGEVFVVCEFDIANNSDKEISVSTITNFNSYIDDYAEHTSISATMMSDKHGLSGTVAAGKKLNGVIGYSARKDWKNLEIHWAPDFWNNEEITFTYSK